MVRYLPVLVSTAVWVLVVVVCLGPKSFDDVYFEFPTIHIHSNVVVVEIEKDKCFCLNLQTRAGFQRQILKP